MPAPRRGAYYYRRKGKRGWYAFLDRDNKDISLKTEDEGEAAQRLADLLVSRKVHQLAPNDRALTEVFGECLVRAKTNHTKKTTYEIGLNAERILKWLEARNVVSCRAVNLELVEDYKTSRHTFDKVSAARVNRELDTWKKAMKVAVDWKVYPKDGLENFVKLREPRPQPHQRGLSKAEITKFLRKESEPYRSLFRTVVGTGMRDDEMRHMDETDIQPPVIVVTPKPDWTTKGYRYRAIPVTPQTIKAARAFVKAKPTMSLDPKSLWKRIQRAAEAAGVPPFSMHDLRRGWASHMLKAGHSLQNISRWLGHADIMTTMRYLRVVDTELPSAKTLPF